MIRILANIIVLVTTTNTNWKSLTQRTEKENKQESSCSFSTWNAVHVFYIFCDQCERIILKIIVKCHPHSDQEFTLIQIL